MSLDPYRTPATREPDVEPSLGRNYDVFGAAALALAMGLMRVGVALARHEAPSREIEIAELVVLLAVVVGYLELGGGRPR